MKHVLYLILFFLSLPILHSCNKSGENYTDRILNYEVDCTGDSMYYYYTFDYDKIYMDLSTCCITIKFSISETEIYSNILVENHPELDSIAMIDAKNNVAFGYLKQGITCEEIKSLLISLTQDPVILAANPNFILKECIERGSPPDDEDCMMGLSDLFVVKLKDGVPSSTLTSLFGTTRTTLVKEDDLFSLISADKHSMGNSLEMSRYFYETGYFKFAHPDFYIRLIFPEKSFAVPTIYQLTENRDVR